MDKREYSQDFSGLLGRASESPEFAEYLLENREKFIKIYSLEAPEIELLRGYDSPEQMLNDHKYIFTDIDARRGGLSTGVFRSYSLVFVGGLIILIIYFTASFYVRDLESYIGIPSFFELNQRARLGIVVPVTFIAIIFVILLYQRIRELSTASQIAIISALAVIFSVLIAILIGNLLYASQLYLVRTVMLLVFTSLPASFYYLFITSKRKTLWEEFVYNFKILDPIGFKDQYAIYKKKFETIYGSSSPTPLEDSSPQREPETSMARPEDGQPLEKADGFTSDLEGSKSVKNPETSTAELEGSKPVTRAEAFTTETAFPVILAIVIIGFGWILCLFTIPFDDEVAFTQLTTSPFTFGFLGAYLFSVGMLFRRYVQSDLKTTAYSHASKRIITTWIWAFLLVVLPLEAMLPDNWDVQNSVVVLAFAIGIFPDIGYQLIEQFLKSALGFFSDRFKQQHPLNEIDGMTIWIEARLLEEDIENIQNLVTANLLDLILRTNIHPKRLIDWIDQGILCLHTDKNGDTNIRKRLEELGIATASDLIANWEGKLLEDNVLNKEQAAIIPSLVKSIENSPNIYYIKAWRGFYQRRIEEMEELGVS